MGLFQELRRRNVFKVGVAYAVTTWVLLQLTDMASGMLELPTWAPKLVLLLLAVGFVPALIMAWAFELTPEGIKLEKEVDRSQSITTRTGRKLDYTIMILLGLSLAYFIWESRYKDEIEAITNPPPVLSEAAGEADSQTTAVRRKAIAVLPFANRSDQASDQYFTDGIHDDLLTQLSKLSAFSVISRTSVMEYRDTAKNLKEIARELDVAHVMEGAVQRAGNRVRINVQLIDAATDEHLWAEIYDRELTTENLFDIQSEIARAIAGALQATLSEQELSGVSEAPTDNVAAYELYLQARQFRLGESQLGYQQALEMYTEALRLDPTFALVWTGMADAHLTNYWLYGGNPEDRDLALAAIEQARSLKPEMPELALSEGAYWYWGHLDYERALYHLGRALQSMPGNPQAWMFHGWASRRDGQWEQALASIEEALRLDPRAAYNWVEYAQTLGYLHRFEAADEAVRRARELDTGSFWLKRIIANHAILTGSDLATAVQVTVGVQHSGEPGSIITYVEPRLMDGRFADALEAVRAMPDKLEMDRSRIQLRDELLAYVHTLAAEPDAARAAANAAWFRLQGLREQLGEDYRILHAEAIVAALRLDTPDSVRERVTRAVAARPADAVEDMDHDYDLARALALAGLTGDAVAWLSPRLAPPSVITVDRLRLDPAFDRVRDEPGFTALLEGQP